jgi:membrane-bound lytic murein transglycosylase D
MARRLHALPLAVSLALAACASGPSPTPRPVANAAAVSAAPTFAIPPAPVTPGPAQTVTPDLWQALRGSFAMADCDADPAVETWARRYTRHPDQFEGKLRAILPRLVYVQQIAAEYDVPGEFALLPWVESHFQPVPGRRGRPAGMWQIMPRTAGAMGLRVDGHYDGRLDVPASAHAVMKLLRDYHEQFDDWRVADYAYNSGAFAAARLLDKHGAPPAAPAIPAWPVRNVTRQHLTKLLAIACVVREPERFGVSLPTLAREQHLVQVPIYRSMPMALAADHAGMSVDALKSFNAGFRGATIDVSAAPYLLLPAMHARQFSVAVSAADAARAKDPVVDATTTPESATATAMPDRKRADRAPRTHTVRSGDNLWQIARRYSVDVSALRRWNNLQHQALQPGQVLTIGSAN